MKKLVFITLIAVLGTANARSLEISEPLSKQNPIIIQMNQLDREIEALIQEKKALKGYQLIKIRKVKDKMLNNRKRFRALQKQLKRQQQTG